MEAMNLTEKKAAYSIAILVALRMYGLFLIMPVFSVYAKNIEMATPFLTGIAIGVYGLTQAFLQIPMGFLSDMIGRKSVITIGLLMFIVGSVVAALATDIWGIIIGRAIQGMGAIASTGMALIADVSRESQRGKMMGIVGASIGLAFMLAFITGPILAGWFGVSGLFWITAILAAMALMQLHVFVKEPEKTKPHSFRMKEWLATIRNKELIFLDVAIFLLHASITAIFVILPLILVEQLGFSTENHWKLYLPVLFLSLAIMIPLIIRQEKNSSHALYIRYALLALGFSILLMSGFSNNLYALAFAVFIYFGFFNFLEAAMPAFLSRLAGTKYRGAAMGAFTSAEFFGAFCGGAFAGWGIQYGYNFILTSLSIMLVLAAVFSAWVLTPRGSNNKETVN